MQQDKEITTPPTTTTSEQKSFNTKTWSKQVIKKTSYGVGVGALMGLTLGLLRKRFNASSFLNRWSIGVKPLRMSETVVTTGSVQPPTSIFNTTVALAGNVGISCYVYFSVEEYLHLSNLIPSQFISHFVSAFGLYSSITFFKRLMLSNAGNKGLAVPYYLLRSMAGGLGAGTAAMSLSLLGLYIEHRIQLYKLKNNLTADEYREMMGISKEEEEKTFMAKIEERLPVWLTVPSSQNRNALDEIRKYHSLRSVEITTLDKKSKEEKENQEN